MTLPFHQPNVFPFPVLIVDGTYLANEENPYGHHILLWPPTLYPLYVMTSTVLFSFLVFLPSPTSFLLSLTGLTGMPFIYGGATLG